MFMANNTNETIEYIKSELNNIEYGSILITIHDGKVTQIDKNEKTRFPFSTKPHKE